MNNNIKNKYPIIWGHSYKTNKNSKVKILVLPPLEILNWLFSFDEQTGRLYRIRGADGKDYNFEVKQLDAIRNI